MPWDDSCDLGSTLLLATNSVCQRGLLMLTIHGIAAAACAVALVMMKDYRVTFLGHAESRAHTYLPWY